MSPRILPKSREEYKLFDIQCRIFCSCTKSCNTKSALYCGQLHSCSIWKWCLVLVMVLTALHIFIDSSSYLDDEETEPLIEFNSKSRSKFRPRERVRLSDTTTLERFMKAKPSFENMGVDEDPKYPPKTPTCKLNLALLRPVAVNKSRVKLEWVEQLYPQVKSGGFYAPPHCRSRHKVAVLVPFRNRESNLAIFLRHIHPFLQKQLLEYRVFVIEQYGFTRKFNKGSLYNIGFFEIQRFGVWHCLIFHDVDLLPLDERILYSCPRTPTHMSPSVEQMGYQLPYLKLFGGVTVMTPEQFYKVNGYSNAYWDWGAEDDDMFIRVQARRLPVLRYNSSIGRYATLPHAANNINPARYEPLSRAKRRFREEGISSIEYKLINITKRKLFTHILANVNPYNTTVK